MGLIGSKRGASPENRERARHDHEQDELARLDALRAEMRELADERNAARALIANEAESVLRLMDGDR